MTADSQRQRQQELAAVLRTSRPELNHLPRGLHDCIVDLQQVHRELLGWLKPHEAERVTIVSSGVLRATVPWQEEGLFLAVHAAPSYYGTEWYDSVAVEAPNGGEWYAQVRCLFWFRHKEFALVRWYEELPARECSGDVLVKHGCKAVKWFAEGRAKDAVYDVLDLPMLKRRVYVVPDFVRGEGFFHVSAFKWDRLPPLNVPKGKGVGESA